MVASARAFCSSVWEHEGALRCAKNQKKINKKTNNNNKMMCTYACASMREASKARANALSPSAAVDECVWLASKRVRALRVPLRRSGWRVVVVAVGREGWSAARAGIKACEINIAATDWEDPVLLLRPHM